MALGKRIKMILDRRGMSIKELSDLSGVNYGALSSLIRRDSESTNTDNLNRIADALDVDVVTLTGCDAYDSFFQESKDYLDKALQKSLLFHFDQMNNVGKSCSIDVVQRLAATGPLRKDYVDPFKELENAFNSDPEGSE